MRVMKKEKKKKIQKKIDVVVFLRNLKPFLSLYTNTVRNRFRCYCSCTPGYTFDISPHFLIILILGRKRKKKGRRMWKYKARKKTRWQAHFLKVINFLDLHFKHLHIISTVLLFYSLSSRVFLWYIPVCSQLTCHRDVGVFDLWAYAQCSSRKTHISISKESISLCHGLYRYIGTTH